MFDDLRVFWCGKDRSLALTRAMEYKHLGLIRNRRSFGLRLSGAVFNDVWQKKRPGEDVPPAIRVVFKWRLSGIPDNADVETVTSWLVKIGWKAKVLKRLRNAVWLVGGEVERVELASSFNSLPVLIEPLVEVSKEPHVIVAGAWKPSVPQSHSTHDDPLQRSDPWARWNKDQPVAATSTRPTPAPMANALQQQDTKIDRMQAHLTALEGKLATHVDVTSKELSSLRADMKQSHVDFHQSLRAAMKQQSDQLTRSMESLFRTHASKTGLNLPSNSQCKMVYRLHCIHTCISEASTICQTISKHIYVEYVYHLSTGVCFPTGGSCRAWVCQPNTSTAVSPP